MKFWTSSETTIDVDESLNLARRDVEQALGEAIDGTDYGGGVVKWALIYILIPELDLNYREVRRFHKRTGVVEFRLRVKHAKFKESDMAGRRALLCAAVLRSIDLSSALQLASFQRDRFRSDVKNVCLRQGWIGCS